MPGLAHSSLNGCDQCRFFAANKGACALYDAYVEREPGTEDVFPEHAEFPGLRKSGVQMLNGQGIFGADINDALRCTGGISSYQHAFENAVRIAFEDASVHVRTRVAFVGVANDVFCTAVSLGSEKCPFLSRRKPGSPPSPQSGCDDLLENKFRVTSGEGFGERQIPPVSYVIMDTDRVDLFVSAHDGSQLFFEKRKLVLLLDGFSCFGIDVKQLGGNSTSRCCVNNRHHVVRADPRIEGPPGLHEDRGLHGAEPVAACDAQTNPVREVLLKELFFCSAD
ncbi:MAG TPA: hypothetical protein PK311_00975 [Syntrophales bacterium]|nr:hypothetical protein [Syntrophales bacterium]HQC23436.1 hypothetical protein [Syntrophales bacterium]HQF75090.1 hypothetical protein [Syntrophales bacterium]HQK47721.1 hypothetical protein [Syntrophales bacterium]